MPYRVEVGMDLHKEFSVFASLNSKGKVLGVQKMFNDTRNFDNYFKQWSSKDVRVTVESTRGVTWVLDYLDQHGIAFVVANPFLNRAIANVHCKNDTYDATVLADLTRCNMVARCYVPSHAIRDLRDVIAHRNKLVQMSTKLKNKVHLLLAKYNLQQPYTSMFGPRGRTWLNKQNLSELHSSMLQENLELLNQLTPRINALEVVIRNKVKDHPYYHLLQTIPGVGALNAAIIISRVDDISRFKGKMPKFIRYAGLSVNTRASANKIHFGHINKRSDKFLRTAFVDAAIVAKNKDAGLAAFYQYLLSIKGKGIARSAVARKLARSAFWVMAKKQPYHYRQIQPQWVAATR